MKELNTLADCATIKQQEKDILLDTKGQYMKESKNLVNYATIKQQERMILLDIKGQYTKESNTLVDYAAFKQREKEVFFLAGMSISRSDLSYHCLSKSDYRTHKNMLYRPSHFSCDE